MSKLTDTIRSTFNKYGVYISVYMIMALILVNSILTYQYKAALDDNLNFQKTHEDINHYKEAILSNLNTVDMSLRGYFLVRNDAFLDTYNRTKGTYIRHFAILDTLLPKIAVAPAELKDIRAKVNEYYKLMDEAVQLDQEEKTEAALAIIKNDFGTKVWESHVAFTKVVNPILEGKRHELQSRYDSLIDLSFIFQVILFIIGIPTLIFAVYRLKKNSEVRRELYKALDNNNRELIFNANVDIDLSDEKKIVGGIIENLKKTASFIKEIANGNYNITWEGLNESNRPLNKENIAGELMQMREKMEKQTKDGERQLWVSEGLTKLSEILRDHQDTFQEVADNTLTFIVNYLDAQQGGLFVYVEDSEKDKTHLSLASCYAFSRKKYESKRVEIGEGLIGQAYLEGEPIYLLEIPSDYIRITSGLGDANPNCLLVFPMKQNEKVEAIIELASFNKFDSFAMDFIENASKTIAASIASAKNNQKTKELLEISQQQAEEMRAQEEEMRQNMEELEATQEEMKRKENELRKLLEQQGKSVTG